MLRPALDSPTTLPGKRLQLGEYELDIGARELRRPGARRGKRLTVKAQQVLLVLALRPGEVLTREALMDAVWPDSFPTGDVLTQAIVQLRRALDDDADSPRFIETIARSGYRLLCEAQWSTPSTEPVPAPGAAPPAQTGGRARLLWWLLPVLLAALIAGWSDAPWRQQAAPRALVEDRSSLVPRVLAASPAYEQQPVLSPDGSLIAFVVSQHELGSGALFLQSSAEFTARQLTRPPDGARDDTPAWSPDQRWIAFRRVQGEGEEQRCELRRVSVASAAERTIGPCAGSVLGLAFTAGGEALIAGGYHEPGSANLGLRRIALDSGEVQPVPLTGLSAPTIDRDPRISADGRSLLFRRGMATSDLYIVPVEGGRPRAVTSLSGDIRGHDWFGPDGGMVFSRVGENGIQLYRLAAPGAAPEPLEVSGTDPRSDAAGRRIVFQQTQIQYVIRRFDSGSGKLAEARGVRSSRNDLLPAPSPDGQRVAFYSDRSGEVGLWIAGAADDAPAEPVEGLAPHPRFAPVWAADSRYLLVVAGGPDGDGLHEVEVASRRARRLEIPAPIGAVGYLDSQRLVVNRGVDTGFRLAVHARDDGRILSPHEIEGVGYLQVDPAGKRVLFTREGLPGLYWVDDTLAKPAALRDDLLPPRLYRGWRIAGAQLWFLRVAEDAGSFTLWSLPLAELGAEPSQLARLDSEGELLSDFGLAPGSGLDGLWLSEQSPPASDIALVEMPKDRLGPAPRP